MAGYEWQNLFAEAFRANDRNKQLAYADAAERIIRARASQDGKVSEAERIALRTAQIALNVLKHGGMQDSWWEDPLSIVQGDAQSWESATECFEEFANRLKSPEREEWLLQCDAYRERAAINRKLVGRGTEND